MPTCQRCGSYFIRAPCPVCSPPGVEQLIVESKEKKGKTIEELQIDLSNLQENLKKNKLEYETKIQDLKMKKTSLNEEIANLEMIRSQLNEKKVTIEKRDMELANEIKNTKTNLENLETEKLRLIKENRVLEEDISSLEE
ncbi:hypothetical protein [Candidatus Hodarchaeum mangrovi]